MGGAKNCACAELGRGLADGAGEVTKPELDSELEEPPGRPLLQSHPTPREAREARDEPRQRGENRAGRCGWVGSPRVGGVPRSPPSPPHLPKQRHRLSAKREKEEEPRCPGQGGTRVPVTGPPPASPRTRLIEGPKASSSLLLHPNTGVGVGYLRPHLCEACVQRALEACSCLGPQVNFVMWGELLHLWLGCLLCTQLGVPTTREARMTRGDPGCSSCAGGRASSFWSVLLAMLDG